MKFGMKHGKDCTHTRLYVSIQFSPYLFNGTCFTSGLSAEGRVKSIKNPHLIFNEAEASLEISGYSISPKLSGTDSRYYYSILLCSMSHGCWL